MQVYLSNILLCVSLLSSDYILHVCKIGPNQFKLFLDQTKFLLSIGNQELETARKFSLDRLFIVKRIKDNNNKKQTN